MNTIKNMVPVEKYRIKCPYEMSPTRIVVHNTANDASARNEIENMISNNNEVSFHYAVDDIEIVQGVEENRNTWNAGDGADGTGNRHGISIEICYSKSGGEKFIQAEKNAVKLIANILRRYNWGIDKVTKHQDYNGKYCPHRTLDMGWQRFLDMIKSELYKDNENLEEDLDMEEINRRFEKLENEIDELRNMIKGNTVQVPTQPSTNFTVGQRVTLQVYATNYATGEKIPSKYLNKQYTIQQVGDGKVLLKELFSWVLNQDVK